MNHVLTRAGRKTAYVCRRWFIRNFAGVEPMLCLMASVVAGLVGGAFLAASFWPTSVGHTVSILAVIALVECALLLARKLLRCLLGHSLGWLMSLGVLGFSVADTVRRGSGEGWSWRVILFSALTTAVLWLLAAGWYGVAVKRSITPTIVITTLVSTGMAVLMALFLFTDGFDNHYIDKYLALSDHRDVAHVELESSLGMGAHEVKVVDYGPGEVLEANTINMSRYMSRGEEDLEDYYVDAYWDYDLNAVPMRGRVWYPAEEEHCPVLFFAHGNHHIATESYLGYDYLGEYLASHGYVVVSVDQNACNMLSGENDGRSVLMLEHIELLLGYNRKQGNPLYRRLDEENIAVGGHSRGGEMVATAYLFNEYDHYPENGTITFDYHFSIKSLIAIAPTVNQYKPADHSVALEDVSYLLLHGAADRDVTNFMGMSQYENISFTGNKDRIKTALYIGGANHGQFNSLWGEYDQKGPFTPLFNTASLLPESDQQEIARVFIKVFLDVTLREDDSCRSLLTDWDDYAGQLPETVYAQCYETSNFIPIADFEEDSKLETATMDGVTLSATDVNWWTEELVDVANETAFDTHALRLRWGREATYCILMPKTDLTSMTLCFDICDLDQNAVDVGHLELLDAEVILRDIKGGTAVARLRDHATVYPILPVRTDKLDFLFDTCTYKQAFATVSIPVEAFVPGEQGFDPTRVQQIRFQFDRTGQASLDNIGLEK